MSTMDLKRRSIFISSVQKELSNERRALKVYIEGEPLLGRFFDVFLFEDLPASDRRADDVYLDEVDRSAIYIGLFGNEYGFPDGSGPSPTEREFDRATEKRKTRLVYVKGPDDKGRQTKMLALIQKAGAQLIRRRFTDVPDLTSAVYASLVERLERDGLIRTVPFAAAVCPGASLGDISNEKVEWFLDTAVRERKFALTVKTSVENVLTHLNLLDGGLPSHAAILLFGREPQRFLISSEVKCLHYHGTEVHKPIRSYQIYKGTVFDLVDQAVDFVMSKIVRSVGTREQGPQAPVEYDLPKDAISEAIVNAVAHRDYVSNASVQVMLFADRLEVWNPGELPPSLNPESLRHPHASIPRNPLIAESFFLTRYIEKAGTGTLDMIDRCREAGLADPDFRQDGDQWVVTLWRDWLTDESLSGFNLNDRQTKAVIHMKSAKRITNSEYQVITGASDSTALRELKDLEERGIVERVGETGRGTYYVVARRKPVKKPSNPS